MLKISLSVLFIFQLFLLTSCTSFDKPKDKRPNIVLIFSDDQGMNDLSCFGSEISTPNIDSIAADGMKFNSWYVASSICTPSRFSLMTGKYPSRSKDRLLGPLMFLEKQDHNRGIKKSEVTIAEVLRKSGYDTALIGKWHLVHGTKEALPVSHGFQEFNGHTGGCIDYFTMRYGIKQDWYDGFEHDDTVGYATDIITDKAVEYISKDRENPFFLYLSYNAPHFGKGWDVGRQQVINFMQAKDDDLKSFKHIKDPIRRQFAAMVKTMDDGIGRVLQSLREKGLDENTLVLFMPDNGGDYKYGGSNKPFRGQKATLFEGGIRVPCVMKFPRLIPSGIETDAQVGAIDLFPTFCQLAGVEPSVFDLDGQIILPVMKGELQAEREMYFELHHASALRVGNWKYLKNKGESGMLFNLQEDPYEKRDLSSDKPLIFKRLESRCAKLMDVMKSN